MPIEQIDSMPMMRVFFSKTGRAKYTSHLDAMRAMTRAFRRSGLPVWHTQGFNPHLYLNFALPIALGYESLCESFDIRLTEELPAADIVARLNAALPAGFAALRAAAPVMKPAEIAWADYEIRLIFESAGAAGLPEKLRAFLGQPVIEVEKKTKKGMAVVDIRPFSRLLSAEAGGETLTLGLRMAAGLERNINPTLLLKAYYRWINREPDGVKVTRTAILTKDLADFC